MQRQLQFARTVSCDNEQRMFAVRPDSVALRGVPAVTEMADTVLVVAEVELPRYGCRMGQGELLGVSILFGGDEVVALGLNSTNAAT